MLLLFVTTTTTTSNSSRGISSIRALLTRIQTAIISIMMTSCLSSRSGHARQRLGSTAVRLASIRRRLPLVAYLTVRCGRVLALLRHRRLITLISRRLRRLLLLLLLSRNIRSCLRRVFIRPGSSYCWFLSRLMMMTTRRFRSGTGSRRRVLARITTRRSTSRLARVVISLCAVITTRRIFNTIVVRLVIVVFVIIVVFLLLT